MHGIPQGLATYDEYHVMSLPVRLTWLPRYDKKENMQHKNWPRCRPFMRHSISEDVPSNRRGLVTRGYWAWIFAAAGFCADWLTITLMWDPLPVCHFCLIHRHARSLVAEVNSLASRLLYRELALLILERQMQSPQMCSASQATVPFAWMVSLGKL